jgi:FAD/FMN-containing dehydrogenase
VSCEMELTGRVIQMGDPGYEEARKQWNPYVDTFPEVFVFAQKIIDIQNAIRWARKNDVPIRARSGRHALDKSLSESKGGIVIDVSDMAEFEVLEDRDAAIVQTGCHVAQVVKALARKGYLFPFGDAPTVGLGGITMGGGITVLQRTIGLISDNLIGLTMVDAQGDIVHADRRKNEDLLWASRGGGGGNFGINAEYVYKLHRAPECASVYKIIWPWFQFERIFNVWQQWAPNVDTRLGSIMEVSSESTGVMNVRGLFLGEKKELARLLKPLLNTGTPTDVTIETVPYSQAIEFLLPDEQIPGRTDVKNKFSSTWAPDLLPEPAIAALKRFIVEANGRDTGLFFLNSGGLMNRISPDASAFFWRDTKFYLEWSATWVEPTDEARNLTLVEETRKALIPYTEGSYINVPDQFIKNSGPVYYGGNFDRLRRVKTKYDPENVFNFPQSIPPLR